MGEIFKAFTDRDWTPDLIRKSHKNKRKKWMEETNWYFQRKKPSSRYIIMFSASLIIREMWLQITWDKFTLVITAIIKKEVVTVLLRVWEKENLWTSVGCVVHFCSYYKNSINNNIKNRPTVKLCSYIQICNCYTHRPLHLSMYIREDSVCNSWWSTERPTTGPDAESKSMELLIINGASIIWPLPPSQGSRIAVEEGTGRL